MSRATVAVDRSQPPPPGELRPFDFPAFHHTRLDNGLRIFAARMPRVPLVSLEILLPAGGYFDSVERPGLASLHGGLLDEGTASKSALEIAALVEGLGGSLGSAAGWNMAYVEAMLLAQHLESGLELMTEIVRSPGFPESEIERLKHDRLAEILRRKVDPSALARRAFHAAVYNGTVYGQPRIGTAESLESFDREALQAFYQRHIGPRGASLIAVGDLDPEAITALAASRLGDWPAIEPPPPPVIEPAPLAGSEVHIVDRPGSAQVQLQLGHLSVPRAHPDFPRLLLLNAIFGGKFTSRINLNLREKHGYTYGAQSQFIQRLGPGPFLVRAAVATEVAGAAVEQLILEMRRIRDEPVSRADLAETQDYLIGVFPYTLQTIGDLTKRLEAIAVFDLPLNHYETYPSVFAEITRDHLQEAARQHFDPDHLAIVAVGPAATLEPQLERFGPVRVHQP